MQKFTIEFTDCQYSSLSVEENSLLADVLSIENSPVLFGCYMGMCASCLIEVNTCDELLPPPEAEEQETLQLYAENKKNCRLACQLRVTTNMAIKVPHQNK